MAKPHDPAYVDGLATSLRINRPDALEAAENELQRLRTSLSLVALWVHNPAYDPDARRALAELLGIPAPEGTRNGH